MTGSRPLPYRVTGRLSGREVVGSTSCGRGRPGPDDCPDLDNRLTVRADPVGPQGGYPRRRATRSVRDVGVVFLGQLNGLGRTQLVAGPRRRRSVPRPEEMEHTLTRVKRPQKNTMHGPRAETWRKGEPPAGPIGLFIFQQAARSNRARAV